MRDIPLEVPLSSFSLGWRRQGDDAHEPRIEQGGHALDDAPLARRVAALEYGNDPEASVPDPFFELHQLNLQAAQLLLVVLLG